MTYDSLYWTDRIPYDEIRNKLRIYGKGYTSAKIVDAWVDRSPVFGLPRQWARQQQLTGSDMTITVPREWPKFKGHFRYNQQECVDLIQHAIWWKYGALLESPTGWGKTIAALAVAANLNQKTLVLVHKGDLVKQWTESARRFFSTRAGKVQGDKWDYGGNLTIAMIQTLRSRGINSDFANSFGMVVVDEGHHIPCETVTEILSKLPARYRLGVSATWRRSDQLDNLWKWHIGEVEAVGARPKIPAVQYQQTVPVTLDERKFRTGVNLNHSRMLNYLAEHPAYNQYIVNEIRRAVGAGRQILVVSHRLKQLEYFFSEFPNSGVYAATFRGKNLSMDDLDQARNRQVILATYKKVEEGTDIPRLDCLFLTTPCGDPEQVVGRVCRDHPDKKKVVIVDFVVPHGYNYALAAKRLKIYNALEIERG